MASNHESMVRFVAVSQFDGSAKLLTVDLSSGKHMIVPAEKISGNKITFGQFEFEESTHSPAFIALIATPDGPLLISEGVMYQPAIARTMALIVDEGGCSRFRVLHDGTPILEMSYAEKWGVGLHPYVINREDIDFYFWLKCRFDKPDFYQAYTREIVLLDAK